LPGCANVEGVEGADEDEEAEEGGQKHGAACNDMRQKKRKQKKHVRIHRAKKHKSSISQETH
jgi:hypothetical protein